MLSLRCSFLRQRWRALIGGLLVLGLGVGVAVAPLLAKAMNDQRPPRAFDALEEAAIDPIAELPDLRGVPAGPRRKAAFFELLVPIVEAENARIAAQRDWLLALRQRDKPLDAAERQRLEELCESYRLACPAGRVDDALLKRVDTLPLELVIIQAVEESGWGTSRFARQGNNLFGMRCFSQGCGLAQGGSGNRYQSFDSVQAAVRAYLHNLNTHRAYERLRTRRLELAAGRVTAEALIATLGNYAARADYRDVLLSLLRTNGELIRDHRADDAV